MMKEEFIGLELAIIASKNKGQINMKGTIINETKYTFTIHMQGTDKKILKKDATFLINGKTILGNKITKRPEERIKTK